MGSNVPEIQPFFKYLHNFVLAKLANSSIRVKDDRHLLWSCLPGQYLSHPCWRLWQIAEKFVTP